MKAGLIGFIVVVVVMLGRASFFVVEEGTQALITQFGQIVGEPVTQAGLHFKMPILQEARYYDKRILNWDGDEELITTRDKKYIMVDTTARWRINDLRKFAEALKDENGARARLDAILDGATRDTISNHNLVEAVRNSNDILETMAELAKAQEEARKAAREAGDDPNLILVEDEVTGDIERVRTGREKLSLLIAEQAAKELAPLGIELIDVQLRRISYEKSVEEKVFERMISERKRIAERIRSIGKGEDAKIRGKLNFDLKEIESAAYRSSQEIRGEAEGRAIAIYAAAMGRDPNYFEFRRTLEAYRKTLATKGEFILSTDSQFLKMLKDRP